MSKVATPLLEHVILCEGAQDEAFFRHLISARGLPQFSVVCPRSDIDPGGVEGYASRLRALKLEQGFALVKGLLVVGDNDGDPDSAFGNIRGKILDAGEFRVPNNVLTIARGAAGWPSVVIAMLPWAGEQGQLETLCIEAASANNPQIAACVNAFCDCTGSSAWKRNKLEKMRMRSILTASCDQDPNTSLVHAWSRNKELVPLNSSCFDRISEFLTTFPKLIAAG